MNISFKNTSVEKIKKGTIAIFYTENENISNPEVLSPYLSEYLKKEPFLNKYMSKIILPRNFNENLNWLFILGAGQKEKIKAKRWRQLAAKTIQLAFKNQVEILNIVLPKVEDNSAEKTYEVFIEGLFAGSYEQTEFKSQAQENKFLKEINLIVNNDNDLKIGQKALNAGKIIAKAVSLARDLGNAPANICFPESFSKKAEKLCQKVKITVDIWDEKEIEKNGLGGLVAVGQGSSLHPPRLVICRYFGAKKDDKPISLVGKGITFDSGGLSLKPAIGMENMKTDMSGAANVLAVILAAAEFKLKLNLVAFLPLAENMPSGSAFRPGDVIKTFSGKMVEIVNTDAEGRLILAEALSLACQEEPKFIIDMATLTGACLVALGTECAGLFCNEESLQKQLFKAGEISGEQLWSLPLIDEYEDNLKSETADFCHAATSSGGAITAALFLRKFIENNIPWAHIDIAGPSRAAKSSAANPAGATAFGTKALLEFLRAQAQI